MDLSYGNRRLLKVYFRLPIFARELFAAAYSHRVHHLRFGGVFSEQLAELQRNSSLSAEERAADQLSRLKEMLVYAGANVPYYRNLFKKIGFVPQEMRSLDDLRSIPLLERDVLRSQHDELSSQTWTGPKIVGHTSGTTGSTLHFTVSVEANQRHYACLWYHFSWAGIKRGDPIATFGAHPVVPPEKKKPPFWLYDRFENELFFSAQHITPQTAPSYIRALESFQPKMIKCFPSVLNLLAQYILESGISIRPRGVFIYGETLLDMQRRTIEQAFGCPVFNFYSTGERTGYALQCQQGNLHVITETSVVEVLRPDGEPAAVGEVGELVLTNLMNRAMPLIRYRIRDTGTMGEGKCPCGRETPILTSLTGRINDFIVTRDGKKIRPYRVFANSENVKEAQFYQEEPGSVVVRIVPRQSFGPKDENLIMEELRLRLGNEMKIQFQMVDEIPRARSGKFQHIISKIPAVKNNKENI